MNNATHLQLDNNGQLRHFLTIEGLNAALIQSILDKAENFLDISRQPIQKSNLLQGKTVTNLFYEPSTRTRTTFELAAKRLSADVMNINIATSSTSKGESLLDTLHNLEAMHTDIFVVRHDQSGAAHFIAQHVNVLSCMPCNSLALMIFVLSHPKHYYHVILNYKACKYFTI